MLKFGDREFGLSESVPGGLGFKLAQAQDAGDHTKAMSLMLRMARKLVHPDERETFDEFVDSDEFEDLGYGDIDTALGEALSEVAGRPTGKSASSSTGRSSARASSTGVSSSPDIRHLAPAERSRFVASAAS
jgi:hypothetical protein